MSFMPELDNLSLEELIARFHWPAIGHEGYEGYEDSYTAEVANQIWFQHDEAGKVFLLEEPSVCATTRHGYEQCWAASGSCRHTIQSGRRSTSSTSIMLMNPLSWRRSMASRILKPPRRMTVCWRISPIHRSTWWALYCAT